MSERSPEKGPSNARFSPRGEGLAERRVRVRPEQVAFLRYVLEAHDGLAFMHSDGSGEVWLIAPVGREAALDELIRDLLEEGCVDEVLSDNSGPVEG